jgi:hypothetical protein
MNQDKVTALRQLFGEAGSKAGRESGCKVGKLAFSKVDVQIVMAEVRKVASTSAEKYTVKAREFHKMAVRIAEEAGAKVGSTIGMYQ